MQKLAKHNHVSDTKIMNTNSQYSVSFNKITEEGETVLSVRSHKFESEFNLISKKKDSYMCAGCAAAKDNFLCGVMPSCIERIWVCKPREGK